MRHRFSFILAAGIILLAGLASLPRSASADGPSNAPSLTRTASVGFVYVSTYKNRLVNAQTAVVQMQHFFETVTWERGRHYSFLRDVVHNDFRPDYGYVNTPLGFGFGSCGASSLLNKLVQTAMFRDSDGTEKHVFQTIMIWTWRGDKTYGKYGATIFLDPAGVHTRDYIWQINPAYDGPPPKIMTNFDMVAEKVDITMEYGDEPLASSAESTAAATQAATKSATQVPTGATVQATKSPAKATAVATAAPTRAATAIATQAATKAATNKQTNDGSNGQPDSTKVAIKTMPEDPSDTYLPLSGAQNAADLTIRLTSLIKGNRFGVSVIPIGDASQIMEEVGVNQNMETYVASAFKGAVAIYFLENIDASVWRSVPVLYWTAKNEKDVPADYRKGWNQYKDILYNVWTSAIYSENDSTGNVIDYVYTHSYMSKYGDNPITAFNNWAHDSAGISLDSGLRSWIDGKTNCLTCIDKRYGQKAFVYMGKVLIPNNTFSPHDLALIYYHLATKGRDRGYYDVATNLLGTPRSENGLSMIQYYFRKRGIQTASKDGFVGPDSADSDGYYVSTDAGLLTLPDGSQFAVAYMAFDSRKLLDDAILMTGKALLPDIKMPVSAGTGSVGTPK